MPWHLFFPQFHRKFLHRKPEITDFLCKYFPVFLRFQQCHISIGPHSVAVEIPVKPVHGFLPGFLALYKLL